MVFVMNVHLNKPHVRPRRGAILAILLASLVVVELPKWLAFLPVFGLWTAPLPYYALMAALPFALRKVAPSAASFESKWLPAARSHWLWFLPMVLLLLASAGLGYWLSTVREEWFLISRLSAVATTYEPGRVIGRGAMIIVVGPIAQEIFFRAYVLSQLTKLMHWCLAVLIHAVLFALAHVYVYYHSLFPSFYLYSMCSVFLSGVILGTWRIRFGSLLPLALGHMVVNGFFLLPQLMTDYSAATGAYAKCREIDALTTQPPERALPALIAFMGDRDELVSLHAIEILGKNFRDKAEPYLKDALASRDNRIVDRALFVVGDYGYSGLKAQVRAVAWSFKDRIIQVGAMVTLQQLHDEEGLRDIARKHQDDTLRETASRLLGDSTKEERSD
jgi:membrane protease YdiL (CAAX protease family)